MKRQKRMKSSHRALKNVVLDRAGLVKERNRIMHNLLHGSWRSLPDAPIVEEVLRRQLSEVNDRLRVVR